MAVPGGRPNEQGMITLGNFIHTGVCGANSSVTGVKSIRGSESPFSAMLRSQATRNVMSHGWYDFGHAVCR
jgi:hypothetical protein